MEYKEKKRFEEISEQFEELKKIVYNIEALQNLLDFPSLVIEDTGAIEAIRHQIEGGTRDYRRGLLVIHELIRGLIK